MAHPPPLRSSAGLARVTSLLAIALVAFAGSWPSPARAAEATREYDLKAVLMFHFTQFVEWPPTSFSNDEAPLIIGILGRDPFGNVLDDLVRSETHHRRRIVVERYRGLDAVGSCQILFVDGSVSRTLPRLLTRLKGRPVLTVGDFEDFTLRGGMVRFMKNPDEKITLQINLQAAKASGLTVSARLLRVADIVMTRK